MRAKVERPKERIARIRTANRFSRAAVKFRWKFPIYQERYRYARPVVRWYLVERRYHLNLAPLVGEAAAREFHHAKQIFKRAIVREKRRPLSILSFPIINTIRFFSKQVTYTRDKSVRRSVCCRIFEKIRYYFGNSSESIPMSFVLGFYVSLVVKRWWEQYKLLPWPDNLALFISAAIPGNVSITKNKESWCWIRRNIGNRQLAGNK